MCVCTCPILDFVPDQQQKAMAGASKELGCELPGSLGLGQSYVRPPKTLEAQENRTCSDCCTTAHSGAWGAFFTATWSHMYTCSYVHPCLWRTSLESQPYNAACVVQLSVFHYVCMYVCNGPLFPSGFQQTYVVFAMSLWNRCSRLVAS